MSGRRSAPTLPALDRQLTERQIRLDSSRVCVVHKRRLTELAFALRIFRRQQMPARRLRS